MLELLGELAGRLGDKLAVNDGARRIGFGELHRLSRRLGAALLASGAAPGPVGVLLHDRALQFVGLFGCLAAGRACLILDPAQPAERHCQIATEAGLAAIVLQAADTEHAMLDAPGIHAVDIDRVIAADDSLCVPAVAIGHDQPAIILSTSGSSGRPKLVAHSEHGLLYALAHTVDLSAYTEHDGYLGLLPLATGGGLTGSLPVLLMGGTVYLPDWPRCGLGHILRVLREQRVTVFRAGLSVWRALVQADGLAEALSGLRLVRLGGEVILQADLRALRPHLPAGCEVSVLLAATEAFVAHWIVPADFAHDPVRIGVGHLLHGSEALLLDEADRPCPPGEAGELVLRGRHLAIGELQAGRLQSGRMLPDPAEPTRRIYRTGDIARQALDGVLVVLGRKDRMIKLHGNRIEPAKIEAALLRAPGVAEVAVLPQGEPDQLRLVAFVVGHGAMQADFVEDLQALLRQTLPSYMRPSRIVLMDALPMLASGKLDAQRLLADHKPPSRPLPTLRRALAWAGLSLR
jgi:acyl-coenzyme A synthetase/AMP-(fatty) acid ligase